MSDLHRKPLDPLPLEVTWEQVEGAMDALGIPQGCIVSILIEPGAVTVVRVRRDTDGRAVIARSIDGKTGIAREITNIGVRRDPSPARIYADQTYDSPADDELGVDTVKAG